jgi:hypothetical protein
MDNFDLKKYLAEGKLLKDEFYEFIGVDPITESNILDQDFKVLKNQQDILKKVTKFYIEKATKLGVDRKLIGDFNAAINALEDAIFKGDYNKYLAEGRLFEEKMSLEVDDDYIELSDDSGEYDGDLNDDGTVDFSVFYDDGTEFDESNWKSILGKKHAFVKISNQIPTKVEAAGDYVMITVDLEDLKNLIKPNKSKNMKNLGSYETKDSKGNIVKRYI